MSPPRTLAMCCTIQSPMLQLAQDLTRETGREKDGERERKKGCDMLDTAGVSPPLRPTTRKVIADKNVWLVEKKSNKNIEQHNKNNTLPSSGHHTKLHPLSVFKQ